MAKKILNDLSMHDKVSFKDPQYGSGYVLGYNKEIGKHLVGYTGSSKRPPGSFANTGGHFVQKDNKYIYSDRLKNYQYFYYADSTLELLNTEEGNGYNVGDVVEVRFQSNGTACSKSAAWDGSSVRKATVVGFSDTGDPLLYMDAAPGLSGYGSLISPDTNRFLHSDFEGKLDLSRAAFVNGGVVNMNRTTSKKGSKVNVMSSGKVSEKMPFMEMMKSNGQQAAYRVASTQITTGIKAAMITMMEKKGGSNERIQALKEMLDTKSGEAFVSFIAGLALTYLPMVSDNARAQKLAEEFRISGMATVGNELFDVVSEHLMPVITTALKSLPDAVEAKGSEKKRVIENVPSVSEEETETKTEAKTLTA